MYPVDRMVDACREQSHDPGRPHHRLLLRGRKSPSVAMGEVAAGEIWLGVLGLRRVGAGRDTVLAMTARAWCPPGLLLAPRFVEPQCAITGLYDCGDGCR